jgi:uncharacterized protein (TIGR00255 family)
MLRSMTGYGAAAGDVDGVHYSVEVRSVNNRYFKAGIKLPEVWSSAEAEIERILRARLTRGSVMLAVWMKIPDDQAAYRVNSAALAAYLDQLRPLEVEANPMLRLDLGSLLALPGVCEPPPLEELATRTRDGLMALIDQAVEAMLAMRAAEGKAVAADLHANCQAVRRELNTVIARAPRVVADYRQRLESRVKELLAGTSVKLDADQLAREVAIFAERCDVAEEVSRLTGHMEQFARAAEGGESAGRKLDFIAQEMLREANTIGSKANDAEIARAVVEIKTAIDRIKEQVQNVE